VAPPPTPPPARPAAPVAAALAVALAVGVALGRYTARKREMEGLVAPAAPPPAPSFPVALTRVRRAVALARALQADAFGDPTSAGVELDLALSRHRALGADAAAAGGAVPVSATPARVDSLYRLALRTADLPIPPGAMTPLRAMLALTDEHAEALEEATLLSAADFSI
jgi:hypothetical protein